MDELIFLLDFKANESIKVTIKTISQKTAKVSDRSIYADLIVKEKMVHINLWTKFRRHKIICTMPCIIGVAFESSYRISDLLRQQKAQLTFMERKTATELAAGLVSYRRTSGCRFWR